MAALATTSSLGNYPRLSISRYREQLRQTDRANKIDVNYSYRGKAYSYSIRLDKTACHFGNYRHWWQCPKCNKRVAVLYCAGLYVCRHCIGVNYQSQLQQPIDRLFSRADAIRQRLGWQSGIAHGIENKPKGMHQRTYDRLVSEYQSIVGGITANMANRLNRGTP